MTTSISENTALFENLHCNAVDPLIDPMLTRFDRLTKSSLLLNAFFIIVGVIQICALVLGFTFFVKSYALAVLLSVLFFTFFTYFLVRLYDRSRRSYMLKQLVKDYLEELKKESVYPEGEADYYIALATSCVRLANRLHGREYTYYNPPFLRSLFGSLPEHFSCWYHWQDVLQMQELLLQTSADLQVELVKCDPTSLEAHAHLANAYVMLSGLYVDPRQTEGYEPDLWVPPEKYTEATEQKFRTISQLAIEEFKILCDYAPNDPWIHYQLAYSYRDLRMPLEEIREYETILALTPADSDALFKLGSLYFEQGMNAMGLRAYETLSKIQPAKARALIDNYGRHKF